MTGANLKVLLFSTLFPSSARPGHGTFVETRLRQLLKSGQIEARVVAPVPWFPFKGARWEEWGRMAETPVHEVRNGVEVLHPRYFLPPKVGMNIAPLLLAAGAWRTLNGLREAGFDFDVIDAHYYYPDGVAAAILGRLLRKPVCITARGTDLNVLPDYPIPRRWIRWAARHVDASVGVSQALADRIDEIAAPPYKPRVLRNGVDLDHFRPVDKAQARTRLGLPMEALVLLSVGNLIELKGHHLAIEAVARFPGAHLVIVGQGPDREALASLALRLGVQNRVTFAGYQAQDVLPFWYSAADMMLQCSSREGLANVLLECFACGTPVVATPLPGTAEVLDDPCAGVLIRERSVEAILEGIEAIKHDPPSTDAVRRHASRFGWPATTRLQVESLHELAFPPLDKDKDLRRPSKPTVANSDATEGTH
ncbi:MAG: glycosyltransferase [Thauera sp.]|jgi:glycosyltransferase involved in cell wall biosynthesis|nr:MAG: glycosyltransferase family 4 protein [Rhodocyclaceae bacterium]